MQFAAGKIPAGCPQALEGHVGHPTSPCCTSLSVSGACCWCCRRSKNSLITSWMTSAACWGAHEAACTVSGHRLKTKQRGFPFHGTVAPRTAQARAQRHTCARRCRAGGYAPVWGCYCLGPVCPSPCCVCFWARQRCLHLTRVHALLWVRRQEGWQHRSRGEIGSRALSASVGSADGVSCPGSVMHHRRARRSQPPPPLHPASSTLMRSQTSTHLGGTSAHSQRRAEQCDQRTT